MWNGAARMMRGIAVALGLAALSVPAALAQPAEFYDVGSFAPPDSPPGQEDFIADAFDAFDFFNGDTLTVRWFRFTVTAPVNGERYIDIDSRIYSRGRDLFYALYDNAGNLIATDDTDGSFPEGVGAGLSFGSTRWRAEPSTPALLGQDGPLTAGTYWLALVAGGAADVTANPTNWNITTTQSYSISLNNYLDLSIITGNTVPLPPPPNDLCSDALPVGESPSPDALVWSGTSDGSFNDGQSPCYRSGGFPQNVPKDVWFLYTPSRSGIALVRADGGAGGGATPILNRYSGLCGSPVAQCTGGGNFSFGEGVALFFPVEQGVPVLLSVSIRGGYTGPLTLDIDLLTDPCPLNRPVAAQLEPESCGQDLNGGCNVAPPVYGQIAVGRPLLGTLFNGPTLRDTDWYQFTLPTAATLRVSLRAQQPTTAYVLLAQQSGPCTTTPIIDVPAGSFFAASACTPATGTINLAAGQYRVVVTNDVFAIFDCALGYSKYELTLEAPGFCAADFNANGTTDFFDYLDFILAYDAETDDADFDGNGQVDFFDYLEFAAVFAGC